MSDSRVCCLFIGSQCPTSPPPLPGPRCQRVGKSNTELGEEKEATARLTHRSSCEPWSGRDLARAGLERDRSSLHPVRVSWAWETGSSGCCTGALTELTSSQSIVMIIPVGQKALRIQWAHVYKGLGETLVQGLGKWYHAPFHPKSIWPGHIPVSTGGVTTYWIRTIGQGRFMDKNQVPLLEETTAYLTSFTSLLFLAGKTWGIKRLLYKLWKISWNIQGLSVSDEKTVREQIHELWEHQVLRDYTTTIINNSNNSSSNLGQSHVTRFLMLSSLNGDFC